MMKSTGIVRKLDELGRIVIPIGLRRTLNINVSDLVEILVEDGGQIIFMKYNPGCIFCGKVDKVKNINEKYVCMDCLREVKEKL